MAAAVVGTLLGMAGSIGSTASIRVCVGIIEGGAIVITVAGGVVGTRVGFVRMACSGVGIRSVVVGMMAIAGRVFVAGDRGCRKCKGNEGKDSFHGMLVFTASDVQALNLFEVL